MDLLLAFVLGVLLTFILFGIPFLMWVSLLDDSDTGNSADIRRQQHRQRR